MPTLFTEGFEDTAFSETAWDQSSDPILNIVTDPAKAHSGSRVNELVYTPGWNGPGFMTKYFSPLSDVYVRWYERYSPGWIWSTVATKGIFLLPSDPSWGVATGTKFSSGDYKAHVNLEPEPFSSGVVIQPGQWYCFELRWTQSGICQLWIDDVLRIDRSGLGVSPGGVTQFTVSGYYNSSEGQPASCTGQVPCGVPQLQYRWIDDIVVSTERIGCGASPPPPPPPTETTVDVTGKSQWIFRFE